MPKLAEQLAAAEEKRDTLVKEREKLSLALGDPTLVTWSYERGRQPRQLKPFEMAVVRRLDALDDKIEAADIECDELHADLIVSLSGIDGDVDDPEVLLRAAMVTLAKMHRLGHKTVESGAVLSALLTYVKSLAED